MDRHARRRDNFRKRLRAGAQGLANSWIEVKRHARCSLCPRGCDLRNRYDRIRYRGPHSRDRDRSGRIDPNGRPPRQSIRVVHHPWYANRFRTDRRSSAPAIGHWTHGAVHDLQSVCRRLPQLRHTAALTCCHGGCSRGLLRCRCGVCKFSCSQGKGRKRNRRDDGRAHRCHGGRGTARIVDRPTI